MADTASTTASTPLIGNRIKNTSKATWCLVVSVVVLVAATLGSIAFAAAFYGERSQYLYRHAAVAADAPQCSVIGTDILRKGGSAVDAAIASCICLGVVNLQSTGIGGGGFMVVHTAAKDENEVFDFREVAPISADRDMYNEDPDLSLNGPLAIAVPGQLKGLWHAHRRHGRLLWKELFTDSIALANRGFPVSHAIHSAIEAIADSILKNSTAGSKYDPLRELLLNEDNETLKENDILRRPTLGKTLQLIADHGADYFYVNMSTNMSAEINGVGGNYSREDFKRYEVKTDRTPTYTDYQGYHVVSTPPPSSGAVLAMMLHILSHYNFSKGTPTGQDYHYIVESFKLSYAYRVLLGDPEFNTTVNEVAKFMMDRNKVLDLTENLIRSNTTFQPEHYTTDGPFHIPLRTATSHLSVIAPDGDAVAVTTTINTYFGSKIRSREYGFIFNNEMADFSIPDNNSPDSDLPPGPANYIESGKRPQSSTSPAIILDKSSSSNRVVMVVGASGGSTITTGVAQVIADVLSFKMNLKDAIDHRRLHHQLIPDFLLYEDGFDPAIVRFLDSLNHTTVKFSFGNVVQGIYVPMPGSIYAYSDLRKGGKPDGF